MFRFDDCIAFLASRDSKLMAEIHERKLAKAGVTRIQWFALYYIYNNKELTQKQLAKLLSSREPTVVRLLDRMEKEDLVTRVSKDRRTNIIEITEKGTVLYQKGLRITEKYKEQALKNISEEEMDIFKQILEKLVENTTASEEKS